MAFKDFNSYDKNHVILTSDRIIINSKDENIFLSAKNSIALSAVSTINFDIGISGNQDPKKNYFIVNSPYIQFGLPSKGVNEPVAKADSTVNFISEISDILTNFSNQLSSATAIGGPGVANVISVQGAGFYLKAEIDRIKKKYGQADSPIISKITRTI